MAMQSIQNVFKKLNRNQQIASVLVGALAIAFGTYAVRALFVGHGAPAPVVETPPVLAAPALRDPLTGVSVDAEVNPLPQVYAVMIDDSSDAWPQSGTDNAFLVIEAPVEGGIPRLEAFFSDRDAVAKIGPVRSARPYFIDWANELDAMYVHVGGSNQALDIISSNGTFDLNQFWNGDDFWRSTDRYAPHNVYTSTDLLGGAVQAAADRGRDIENLYGAWTFQDGASAEQRPADGVNPTINFYAPTYTMKWTYDSATNRYARTHGGYADKTLEGDQVYADNVAVVVTDISVIDAVGRRQVKTIGSGKAFVFQNGEVIEATWKKDSASERMHFVDADGKDIAMNAGTTWIEVVPGEENLSY